MSTSQSGHFNYAEGVNSRPTPSKGEIFKNNINDAIKKTLIGTVMLSGLGSSAHAYSQQTAKDLIEICNTDNSDQKNSTLVMKAREYVPMQISYLEPEDILPIVGQIERGDKKAYEHIEHLRIAEATRIRDMMWKNGAGELSAEEYQGKMGRLYTGMTMEEPKGYNNYETIGEGSSVGDPSEHAHDARDILNSIIDKANFVVQNQGSPRQNSIRERVDANPDNIYIFGNSVYGVSDKNRRLSQNSENFKKNLARSKNFLIFAAGTNIDKRFENGERIPKSKIYHEDVNGNKNGIYSLPSAANGTKNKDPNNHIMVTVGTNKNGDVEQSDQKTTGSKFPVGFHNQVLFAGRAFPYHDIEDGSVGAGSGSYTTSYPNYVNVAMADLCFQMFAEVKDVDELLDMIRSTALTDYIRMDLNGDGDTDDVVRFDTDDGSYINQPESQPLQLINPAGFFREYCLPADTDLPSEIKTDETLPLNKCYYKGIIFDIPGAEVLIDGERVPFDNENSALIKSQNPFTLVRRLNGKSCKQLGCSGNIEGTIQAVDDERNGLKDLSKTFTVNIDDIVSSIDDVDSEESLNNNSWYSIGGQKLTSQPTKPGVYLQNGKKVVIK